MRKGARAHRGRRHRFLGIPYAEPPFGEHRFVAPVPRSRWDGVLDAGEYGAIFPQTGGVPGGNEPDEGEDCLNLNVWTPDPGQCHAVRRIGGRGGDTGRGGDDRLERAAAPGHSAERWARGPARGLGECDRRTALRTLGLEGESLDMLRAVPWQRLVEIYGVLDATEFGRSETRRF